MKEGVYMKNNELLVRVNNPQNISVETSVNGVSFTVPAEAIAYITNWINDQVAPVSK
jgi:hypothetical protein